LLRDDLLLFKIRNLCSNTGCVCARQRTSLFRPLLGELLLDCLEARLSQLGLTRIQRFVCFRLGQSLFLHCQCAHRLA
jgi:hypothetical protein